MSSVTSRNTTLEAVRGLAALLVVAGHARYALYATSGIPLDGRSKIEAFVLAPTSFGRVSVAVFFVLSGYLVGGQVLRQATRRTFNGRTYFIRRFSRLWFVLAGGVAFTAVLDGISRALFDNSYSGSQGRTTSSLPDMICNLAFLQRSRCEAYGTNESLWSIGLEFFYYMVFAAAVVAAVAAIDGSTRKALLCGTAAIAAVAVFGINLILFAPAWLTGALIAEIERRYGNRVRTLCRRRSFLITSSIMAVFGFLVSKVIPENDALIFVITGIFVAPLIMLLASVDPVPKKIGRRIVLGLASVGEWSYTLYIFHLPLAFFFGVVAAKMSLPVNPLFVYLLFVILPVCVYPFYLAIEARTPTIRRWLLQATEAKVAVSLKDDRSPAGLRHRLARRPRPEPRARQ